MRRHIGDFLIGLSVGAATGLLLAPRAGRFTRARISDASTKGATYLKGQGETVSGVVFSFIEQGKGEIARHKEGVAKAIKEATHAYQRAVN